MCSYGSIHDRMRRSDAKENTASANASVSETEQGEATEQDAQKEEPIPCTLTVWSPSEDQDPEYGQWLLFCLKPLSLNFI